MIINNFNTDKKVFIIAEIGNNHEGNFKDALELIDLAAEAGVDAVKFQTFQTEHYIGNQNKERFDLIKSFELSYNQFEQLSISAKDQGLHFISTPFDIESANFLPSIVDAIKISSGDNNFFPLLNIVAEKNKPIILSTGLTTINEINHAINTIEKVRINNKNINELAVLHCVTSYPVEPKYANLRAIQSLSNSLDYTIGYSDHTLGINAAVSAVCLGARIIEKHFTKDKNFSSFRDHQLSADKKEMIQMVNSIREIEQMLGSGKKELQPPEKEILSTVRRSIVAKNNLSKGKILKFEDITWVRPGSGLSPGEESNIIGKKLLHNIEKGSQILKKHLE